MAAQALIGGVSRAVTIEVAGGLDTHFQNWSTQQGPAQRRGFNAGWKRTNDRAVPDDTTRSDEPAPDEHEGILTHLLVEETVPVGEHNAADRRTDRDDGQVASIRKPTLLWVLESTHLFLCAQVIGPDGRQVRGPRRRSSMSSQTESPRPTVVVTTASPRGRQ
jgi:hypothetical protein